MLLKLAPIACTAGPHVRWQVPSAADLHMSDADPATAKSVPHQQLAGHLVKTLSQVFFCCLDDDKHELTNLRFELMTQSRLHAHSRLLTAISCQRRLISTAASWTLNDDLLCASCRSAAWQRRCCRLARCRASAPLQQQPLQLTPCLSEARPCRLQQRRAEVTAAAAQQPPARHRPHLCQPNHSCRVVTAAAPAPPALLAQNVVKTRQRWAAAAGESMRHISCRNTMWPGRAHCSRCPGSSGTPTRRRHHQPTPKQQPPLQVLLPRLQCRQRCTGQ